MTCKEGSLSYRQPKSLGEEACRKWKSFHFSSRLKMEAADHFCRLALGASSLPYDLGLPLLAFRQTKWYLDAFFFELMSAYDTLLQEMNVLYDINLDMEKVQWSSVKSGLPRMVVDLMEKEWKAEWFKKLRWYRNRATHHMYISSSWGKGELGEKSWDYNYHEVWIAYFDTDANEPKQENIKICPDYLKQMLEHVHAVWEQMAEEVD